jgi:2-methylisocitrate lyase-like PEP mutase family enzyme
MMVARERLRAALKEPGLLVAPFVYDGLQAMIAERSGFGAVYMTGFGTAASHGMPDLGLLTMSEMVANARRISRAVGIPVICDADTGYGNPLNVIRTVQEYEDAGAAAFHIEDQVWPKRCGFLEGKQVIPQGEMVQKVAPP